VARVRVAAIHWPINVRRRCFLETMGLSARIGLLHWFSVEIRSSVWLADWMRGGGLRTIGLRMTRPRGSTGVNGH
jgi:hypothetical protein